MTPLEQISKTCAAELLGQLSRSRAAYWPIIAKHLTTHTQSLEEENKRLKEHKAKLRRACLFAHSALDRLMGDSDIDSDGSPEMLACQLIAETLKETE
jgi:hypothetical protein